MSEKITVKDIVDIYVKALAEADVDILERPHGHWKRISERTHACSICGRRIWVYKENLPFVKYCPLCGARMDEEDTNANETL